MFNRYFHRAAAGVRSVLCIALSAVVVLSATQGLEAVSDALRVPSLPRVILSPLHPGFFTQQALVQRLVVQRRSAASSSLTPATFSIRSLYKKENLGEAIPAANSLAFEPLAATKPNFLFTIFQLGRAAFKLTHEWSHLFVALVVKPTAWREILSPANIRGNQSWRDYWLEGLFTSVQGRAEVRISQTAEGWRDTAVRKGGWWVSVLWPLVVVGAGLFYGFDIQVLWSTLPSAILFSLLGAGALTAVAESIYSDWVEKEDPGVYACGNVLLIGLSKAWSLNQLLAIARQIVELIDIRGRQSGGLVTYFADGWGLRARVKNTKRGDLPTNMLRVFRLVWLKEAVSKFVRGAGFLKAPVAWILHGHVRFATASKSKKKEAHPHQWLYSRKRGVWSVPMDRLVRAGQRVLNTISHNGDFDDINDIWDTLTDAERERVENTDLVNVHGTVLSQRQAGQWLNRVFHTHNQLKGDSPKISGFIDLLHAQGQWDAAARLAWAMGVNRSADDELLTEKQVMALADLLERVFEPLAAGLLPHGAERLSEATPAARARLEAAILTRLQSDPAWSRTFKGREQVFTKMAVQAFFDNDLYTATHEFMKRAVGSFGLVVTSSLAPGRAIISSRKQPMSVAWKKDGSLLGAASDQGALKLQPFDYRIDLDMEGETAEIGIDESGFFINVYTERAIKDPADFDKPVQQISPEVLDRDRLVPLRDNPLVDALPPKGDRDQVREDIRAMPRVAKIIRHVWDRTIRRAPENPESFNLQSAEDFSKFFVGKAIQKAILRHIPLHDQSPQLINWLSPKADELADQALTGQLVNGALASKITILIGAAKQWVAENASMFPEASEEDNPIDLLLVGFEDSLWLGEQFVQDFGKLFGKTRQLVLKGESSNKVLRALRDQEKRHDFQLKVPGGIVNRQTIVLAVSQSGQTFPTVNALLQLIDKLEINGESRVFGMLGELDTPLSKILGQRFTKNASFSRRIFLNMSGRRPAEPSSVAAMAAHMTLTELLIYVAEDLRRVFPDGVDPLGLRLSVEDIQKLKTERDLKIDHDIPALVGVDADGKKVKSAVYKHLNRKSWRWAFRVWDAWVGTIVSGLYVLATVKYHVPTIGHYLLAHQMDAVGQAVLFLTVLWMIRKMNSVLDEHAEDPLWKRWGLHMKGVWALAFIVGGYFIGDLYWGWPSLGTLLPLPESLLSGILADVDVLGYWFMYAVGIWVFRAVTFRPIFVRLGPPKVFWADIPHVYQPLEMFITKLFSMAYRLLSIIVHGGNPRDHFTPRYAHRANRGDLVWLGLADVAKRFLASDRSGSILSIAQFYGNISMGESVETLTVGRGGSKGTLFEDHINIPDLNGPTASDRAALQFLTETRFDSLSRMVAGFSFGHLWIRKVTLGGLLWNFWRTQGGARVFSTASPEPGAKSILWNVLERRGWISRKWAKRLAFMEQIFFTGLLLMLPLYLAGYGHFASESHVRMVIVGLHALVFGIGFHRERRIRNVLLGFLFNAFFLRPGSPSEWNLLYAVLLHLLVNNILIPLWNYVRGAPEGDPKEILLEKAPETKAEPKTIVPSRVITRRNVTGEFPVPPASPPIEEAAAQAAAPAAPSEVPSREIRRRNVTSTGITPTSRTGTTSSQIRVPSSRRLWVTRAVRKAAIILVIAMMLGVGVQFLYQKIQILLANRPTPRDDTKKLPPAHGSIGTIAEPLGAPKKKETRQEGKEQKPVERRSSPKISAQPPAAAQPRAAAPRANPPAEKTNTGKDSFDLKGGVKGAFKALDLTIMIALWQYMPYPTLRIIIGILAIVRLGMAAFPTPRIWVRRTLDASA